MIKEHDGFFKTLCHFVLLCVTSCSNYWRL